MDCEKLRENYTASNNKYVEYFRKYKSEELVKTPYHFLILNASNLNMKWTEMLIRWNCDLPQGWKKMPPIDVFGKK